MTGRQHAVRVCDLDKRAVEYVADDSVADFDLMGSSIRLNRGEQQIDKQFEMLTGAVLIKPGLEDSDMYEGARGVSR